MNKKLNNRMFGAVAHGVPLALMVVFFVLAWLAPEYFDSSIVSKEQAKEGAGVAENLTVILLIPAILAGVYTLIKYRHRLPGRFAFFWILMWTLACVYFAGEEVSWGQWFFHWDTPEALQTINDQQETNLHNMSTWLDQKPRAIVEFWIFLAGVVWPIVLRIRKRPGYKPDQWQFWVCIPSVCFSSALVFTLVFLADQTGLPLLELFGQSELREVFVALFFALYLGSFPSRLGNPANREP